MKILLVIAILAISACMIFGESELESECTRHQKRENSTTNKVPGRVIPKCNKDGSYQSLQCHGEETDKKRFCQCWTKNGDIITSPSRKIKACDCLVKAHQTPAIPGAWKPKCNDDGSYASLQSHGSTGMSWCSSPEGKELSERTRGPLKCT